MRCPHCGAGNPRENRFCLKCSKSLSTESSINSGADSSAFSSAPSQTLPSQNASAPSSVQSAPIPASGVPASGVPGAVTGTQNTSAMQSGSGAMPQTTVASSTLYKPSGLFGANAPVMMLVATLLGAPLIGLLYSFISQYMNLLLFSQLIVGAMLGGLLALAIKTGKCRNARMAIACGVVGGLLLFSTYLFTNSLRARKEYIEFGSHLIAASNVTDRSGKPLRMSAEQARATLNRRVTPLRFFPTYLRMNAESGVTLRGSRSSSSTGGITVQGPWYWVLLAAELGLVMLTASAIAQSSSTARFCERCDEWWKTSTVHKTHPDLGEQLVARAQAGDWQGLRAVVSDKKTNEKNFCHVALSRCPKCSDGTIAINSTVNGTPKTLLQAPVDAQGAAMLAAKSA